MPERRTLLRAGIGTVFVRRSRGRGRCASPPSERIHICWPGEEPENLPGWQGKTAVAISSFDW